MSFLSVASRKLLPRRFFDRVYLLRAWHYDAARYMRHASWDGVARSSVALDAKITKDFHRIEKGLSLPQPRPGFGKDVATAVLQSCRKRLSMSPPSLAISPAIEAMEEYLRFNREHGAGMPQFETEVEELKQLHATRTKAPAVGLRAQVRAGSAGSGEFGDDGPQAVTAEADPLNHQGGTREVDKAQLTRLPTEFFREFAFTRFSVRDFAPGEVDLREIRSAIETANRAPSVCNRQAWKVHLLRGAKKDAALRLQNGNRGFAQCIDTLLVVTVDVRAFAWTMERYQAWIDGGIYAMSLVYALHSHHLGTCCLNWSVDPWNDRQLHQLVPIPDQEVVITFIAVGLLKDRFSVACSQRKTADETLVVHAS